MMEKFYSSVVTVRGSNCILSNTLSLSQYIYYTYSLIIIRNNDVIIIFLLFKRIFLPFSFSVPFQCHTTPLQWKYALRLRKCEMNARKIYNDVKRRVGKYFFYCDVRKEVNIFMNWNKFRNNIIGDSLKMFPFSVSKNIVNFHLRKSCLIFTTEFTLATTHIQCV